MMSINVALVLVQVLVQVQAQVQVQGLVLVPYQPEQLVEVVWYPKPYSDCPSS